MHQSADKSIHCLELIIYYIGIGVCINYKPSIIISEILYLYIFLYII